MVGEVAARRRRRARRLCPDAEHKRECLRPHHPENRIDEAYAFFHGRVKEWAYEVEAGEQLARLELLRITICELLKVVSITLEADDNAQVIFETLNARGTPLLALDLVKNAVFLEASRQALDTDVLTRRYGDRSSTTITCGQRTCVAAQTLGLAWKQAVCA
jgi:hypothetical protein